MHNILYGNMTLESFEDNQINRPHTFRSIWMAVPCAAVWLLHLDSAPRGSPSPPHVHILQDQLISNTAHTRRAEHSSTQRFEGR